MATSPTTATSDPQGTAMANLAREQLAGELGIAADAVSVVRVEDVEWPNSALGCPSEGTMALQVITPGYRIVLRANSTDYTYHTDKQEQVVRCPQQVGTAEPTSAAAPTDDPQATAMANLARTRLSEELGVAPDTVSIVTIEMADWPTSALGCPTEGTMALQVITPGYRIKLRVNDTDYTFHTDTQQQVIRCQG